MTQEYDDFVEKFKPKKTTDDCYTPENIYEVVVGWAASRYGFDASSVVRPFWPGSDYKTYEYRDGCVVVDNPPFSILSEIVRSYNAAGIRYFLFAPTMTLPTKECCGVAVGAAVTYANGANVNTSFVTNMEDAVLMSAPDLFDAITVVDKENQKAAKKSLPKYVYPDHVLTSSMVAYYSKHHIEYRVTREHVHHVPALDSQRAVGKGIFGRGYLLSEKAAAEKAAAEKAAAEKAAAEKAAAKRWTLSERELEIVKGLG